MTMTDEELMAYVDGELDEARCESVRQAIAASDELTRKVAEQRALRSRLRQAFDRTLDEPVPLRLINQTAHDRVANFAPPARRQPPQRSWLSVLALAAGVVLGIALGPALLELTREEPDLVASVAGVRASGALADALSRRLASQQTDSAPIRLGVSFLAKSGEYCRTFVSRHGSEAVAGMACRQGSTWRIDALQSISLAPGDPAGYRQAATPLPPMILEAAEAVMVGDALDARREVEARDHGWRSLETSP
jgi:anti-sigma factor RsiW